jgi:hypothetical protein
MKNDVLHPADKRETKTFHDPLSFTFLLAILTNERHFT